MAAMPAAMSASSNPSSKSVSRVLQTAILQLCNEHVHYNCRLQIVGVLCLTIDDQEDELIVKINNTLKRMNPSPSEKVPVPVSQPNAGSKAASSHKVPIPRVQHSAQKLGGQSHSIISQRNKQFVRNAISPDRHRDSSVELQQKTVPSPHKGRKRSTPVKVHHVIDEGELMNECGDDDQDVVTVIPQAPESSENEPDTPQGDLLDTSGDTARPILIAPVDDPLDKNGQPNSSGAGNGSVHGIIDVRSISEFEEPKYPDQGNTEPYQNGQNKSRNYRQQGSALYNSSLDMYSYVEDMLNCDDMSGAHENVVPIQITPETTESGSSGYTAISGASPTAVTLTNTAALNNLGQLGLKKGTVALIPINALPSSKCVSVLKPISMSGETSTSAENKKTTSKIREMLLKGQSVSDHFPPHKIQRLQESGSPSPKKTSPTKRHDRLRDSLKPEEIKQYFGKRETPVDVKLQCRMDHCSAPPFADLDEYFSHSWLMHNCYICHECGKVFMNKAGIMRHRPIHTGIKRFACNFCKADFHRMDKCKLHVAKHMKGIDKGKPIVVGKHIKVLS